MGNRETSYTTSNGTNGTNVTTDTNGTNGTTGTTSTTPSNDLNVNLIKDLFMKSYLTRWHKFPNHFNRLLLVKPEPPYDVQPVITVNGNKSYFFQADVWIGSSEIIPPDVRTKLLKSMYSSTELPLVEMVVVVSRTDEQDKSLSIAEILNKYLNNEKGYNEKVKMMSAERSRQYIESLVRDQHYLTIRPMTYPTSDQTGIGLSEDEVNLLQQSGLIKLLPLKKHE